MMRDVVTFMSSGYSGHRITVGFGWPDTSFDVDRIYHRRRGLFGVAEGEVSRIRNARLKLRRLLWARQARRTRLRSAVAAADFPPTRRRPAR